MDRTDSISGSYKHVIEISVDIHLWKLGDIHVWGEEKLSNACKSGERPIQELNSNKIDLMCNEYY